MFINMFGDHCKTKLNVTFLCGYFMYNYEMLKESGPNYGGKTNKKLKKTQGFIC